MKFHSQYFFCKKREIPSCIIEITNNVNYPVLVRFGSTDIYLSSIQDLTNFKNSFLSSYEKAMREAKNA